MQTETYENNIMSEAHFELLNKLIDEYQDALRKAHRLSIKLQYVCEPLNREDTGELNQYFKFNVQQKNLNLMFNDVQCKIAQINGELQ